MMDTKTRRALHHQRRVSYDSYELDNGRIEIEGNLTDVKAFDYPDRERGMLRPGDPVHNISARIILSKDYVVQDFDFTMHDVPFSFCRSAVQPEALIGACVAHGWRKSLDRAFGPYRGCSHLRELVFGMGTVAFQTISTRGDMEVYNSGCRDADVEEQPFFINGCHSWAATSPITRQWYPQFAKDPDEAAPED